MADSITSAPAPARPFHLAPLAIVLGGAAATALVVLAGAREVAEAALRAGWSLPLLLVLHAMQLALSAVAWRGVSGGGGPGLWGWLRIRWIREAVNSLLPVAQIGGPLVGIRLLRQHGLPLARGSAGTTLDMTVEAVTQLLFTLLGLATLLGMGVAGGLRPWMGVVPALMAFVIGGFLAAQRVGLLALLERLGARFGRFMPALPAADLRGMHAALLRLQTRRGAVLRAGACHLLAWLLGVVETWLALAAIGHPAGLGPALVLESLGMAARSAGFAVPGALGVQEGGLLLVGGLVGVPAEAAIALSVVKRARELVAGLPGLLAWQWAEGFRLARPAGQR